MPYTPREAVAVSLYNAGVEPLGEALTKADSVLAGLHAMGWELVDRYEGDQQDAAAFVQKAALRAVPDL